ncbi:MAG: RsmB/NOP family class I SAM-dependent RNA methyltransferase [Candidatus Bathyarchaeota archaeon]|nr:RsmB/NOP family class I SAM-dependent RNA methyltransferase [Candidatus Bathyarchaeota archaeon]
MSGKDFFTNRYEQLGWKFREVSLRQAIRINHSNAEEKNLVGRLERSGVYLEKIPFLEFGYWVVNSKVSAGATAEYLLGLYSIQEAAAQIPATLFSALRGKRVLDAAAAPGGKTVQLADLMENSGAIAALDVDKRRLNALSNHLERCHVSNTVTFLLDARQAKRLNVSFERILLDVPCSGNFAADKEWFRHRTMQDIERNARLHRQILAAVTECLIEGGEIVYSTCSLEPEEDELNIDWAIHNLPLQTQEINGYGQNGLTKIFEKDLDSSVAYCKRIWPGETQGFFVCKLKKRSIKT